MSPNFDWQAEDDLDWDALPDDDQTQQPHKNRRYRLLLLLFLLILAGIGAGIVYWQIDSRVDENTQAMRADIISSHNLLQIAEADQDEELFFSVLSGSNSEWTAAQKDLFDAGLLHNRTPLGLSALPAIDPAQAAEDGSLSINFSPDFREAEVVSEQPFTIDIGQGLTETITLQETAVYRMGRERWLLSPPTDTFWGSPTTFSGSKLTLSAPERDAELAERLRSDLERKLDEMCRILVDLNCPQDMTVQARFSTDPQSLITTANPAVVNGENGVLQVDLPAPTLTGIPVDDQGYQALFRAYGGQLVSAVASHLTNFICCRHAAFHQALLHYQLDQLSLRPWPVTSIDYQRILDEQLQIADIDALWRSDDSSILSGSEGWQVYAFLDYLLKTYPQLSAAQMQRELVRHESIYGWLDDASQLPADGTQVLSSSDLIDNFWLEAYIQTYSTDDNQASPYGGDLYLTCELNEGNERESILFRYDQETGRWNEAYVTDNRLFVNPLPDDHTLILMEFDPGTPSWQTQLWQDGVANPILSETENFIISFGQMDPGASSLTTFVFPPAGDDAIITIFDLQKCDPNGCESRIFPSIPIWSPDGTRVLFSDEPNAQLELLQMPGRSILFDPSAETYTSELYYSDRQNLMDGDVVNTVSELTPTGSGHAPFWLDNETIGYIAYDRGQFSVPGQGVLMTPVEDNIHQTLLTVEDLIPALPDPDIVDQRFWIHYVMVDSVDPNLLYVVAMSDRDKQAHVFIYDRQTAGIEYLMNNIYSRDHSLSISPDGRFQILTGRHTNQPGLRQESTLLLLHDRQNNTTTPFLIQPTSFPPFLTYDWSRGGEWLAMMLDNDLVGLFSADLGRLQLIDTPNVNCSSPILITQ